MTIHSKSLVDQWIDWFVMCFWVQQVVGLTASVGVGKAKDVKGAVDHILKLCANLDAGKLCTVQEHRPELLSHTNRAREG